MTARGTAVAVSDGMLALRTVVSCLLLLGIGACTSDSIEDPPGADAAPAATPDSGVTTPLSFLEPCNLADDQCDKSGDPQLVCFGFNAKGPHCSHSCVTAADCAAPSPGCNGMGVCKVP